MPRMHLVEGPVGAGKTTFAREFAKEHKAPCLILDDWFVRLFTPDRPAENLMVWYAERKERCLAQIWQVTLDILSGDQDVVLELGLIERARRQRFYDSARSEGLALNIFLLDAPRELRRERVRARNRDQGPTYSMAVPDWVFDLASDAWEPFDAAEIANMNVRVIA